MLECFALCDLYMTNNELCAAEQIIPRSQMNGAAFPSPTAEMAEMNRIQYELEYTEGISQKMRIPEMLKVASQIHEDPNFGSQEVPHSVIMQVPERIVVAGRYISKPCYFFADFYCTVTSHMKA